MTNNTAFFDLPAGDDRTVTQTVTDSDGDAVDISSAELIKWGLATNETASGTLLLTKSWPASGINLSDPVNGQFQVVLSGNDTSGFAFGTYYQEYSVKYASGDVTTARGTALIRPTII